MKMTYSEPDDALYIYFTQQMIVRSRNVAPDVNIDLDEEGRLVGLEVLNARASGIDLSNVEAQHEAVERPDPEVIRQGQVALGEARKRMREKHLAETSE